MTIIDGKEVAAAMRREIAAEVEAMVAEGKPAELEIVCRFCNTRYTYTKDELDGMDFAKA